MLAAAFALWRSRADGDWQPSAHRPQTRASAFALGAGIMAIELPTAFMYFGAISAILAARLAAPLEISLVVVYNGLFVAPLVVLLVVRRLAGGSWTDGSLRPRRGCGTSGSLRSAAWPPSRARHSWRSASAD